MVAGVVDHHEATAADAGGKGLGHPEHGRRGDRRVHRIATVPKNSRALRGREQVDRSDCPALAHGNRLLDGFPALRIDGGRRDGG